MNRQLPQHQLQSDDKDPSRPVIAVAHDRPGDFSIQPHSHFRAQLVYASEGVMRVNTADSTWVIPQQQAVWVPAGLEHSMSNAVPIALRTLYVHPQFATALPDTCSVFTVPALLRELILYVVALPQDYQAHSFEARLITLIPELLATLEPEPLQLPIPADRRFRMIADALMEQPGDKRPLSYWAERVGASERTLSRHFRDETGISFDEWRRRLRLLSSITMLMEGKSTTAVAYELGYASPSAFIAMFHRALGHPPKRYLKLRSGAAAQISAESINQS